MSNKSKITMLDQAIRRASRCGMTDGTVMRIEFISGFEKFNTRRYHNYETWGQGYRVVGLGVRVEEEDLDDAIDRWESAVQRKRSGEALQPYETWDHVDHTGLLDDWIKPTSHDGEGG